MSAISVSTAPKVAARATSVRSVAPRPCVHPPRVSKRRADPPRVRRRRARRECLRAPPSRELRLGRRSSGLPAIPSAPARSRVAVDGAVDRVQRPGGRRGSGGSPRPASTGAQRGPDQAGVLAHPDLLTLGALDPSASPSGSAIEALPTALAMSVGRSGDGDPPRAGRRWRSRSAGPSPCASARTSAACGNVTERKNGLTWKRSETSTRLVRRFGSRKVHTPVRRGEHRQAGARDDSQKSGSLSRSSSCSEMSGAASPSWRTASAERFLNSMRAAPPASCGSGLVGR